MKYSVCLWCMLLFGSIYQTHAQNICFSHQNLDSLILLSQNSGKLVFIDAYTQWCGPCKLMDRDVFTNSEVASYYNGSFYCLKLDMETKEGRIVGEKYKVNSYPTFLYIDSSGSVVHRSSGSRNAKKFVELGEIANNPNLRQKAWEDRFLAGNRSEGFLLNYLEKLSNEHIRSENVLLAYFDAKKEDFINEKTLDLLINHLNSTNNILYDFMLANMTKIEESGENYGSGWKYELLFDRLFRTTVKKVKGTDSLAVNGAEFDKIVSSLQNCDYKHAMRFVYKGQMLKAEIEKDIIAFNNYATKFIDAKPSAYTGDYSRIYNTNYSHFKTFNDTTAFREAIKWLNESIEKFPVASNNFFMGKILYQQENYKEALKYFKKAKKKMKKYEDYLEPDIVAYIDKCKMKKFMTK